MRRAYELSSFSGAGDGPAVIFQKNRVTWSDMTLPVFVTFTLKASKGARSTKRMFDSFVDGMSSTMSKANGGEDCQETSEVM